MNNENGEKKMVPLIQAIIQAYNNTLNFADKIMDKLDDEKYAKAVIELYGQEPTYNELDAQIEIIKNATDIPTEKKLDLLRAVTVQRDAIRDKEMERKKKSAEIIDNGTEKKGNLAGKIAIGVLSGGVSLLPDAVNAVKGLKDKKSEDTIEIIESEDGEE